MRPRRRKASTTSAVEIADVADQLLEHRSACPCAGGSRSSWRRRRAGRAVFSSLTGRVPTQIGDDRAAPSRRRARSNWSSHSRSMSRRITAAWLANSSISARSAPGAGASRCLGRDDLRNPRPQLLGVVATRSRRRRRVRVDGSSALIALTRSRTAEVEVLARAGASARTVPGRRRPAAARPARPRSPTCTAASSAARNSGAPIGTLRGASRPVCGIGRARRVTAASTIAPGRASDRRRYRPSASARSGDRRARR